MRKLCYIMPEYNPRAHTHFAYLVDFIKEISQRFEVFLIIEKGELPKEDWGCREVVLTKSPIKLFRQLRRAHRLHYRDFYVHYAFGAAFLASLLVKWLGGRVFYWNCGLPWNYQRGWLRGKFEYKVYQMINYLITGTEGMKRQYAEHYQLPLEKIRVMPNWTSSSKFQIPNSKFQIDELRKKLNIKPDQKVLFFAHRLSSRKGAQYLVPILEAFKKENVVLLVAGDGPDRSRVDFKIIKFGLEEKVRMLGWVPNEELSSYFELADVFLVPSEEEGFPHVILEAMAYGAPFVAFAVGGVKEIIPADYQEMAVASGNLSLFIEKIRQLLKLSRAERERRAEFGQHWVQRYRLETVADIFKKIVS